MLCFSSHAGRLVAMVVVFKTTRHSFTTHPQFSNSRSFRNSRVTVTTRMVVSLVDTVTQDRSFRVTRSLGPPGRARPGRGRALAATVFNAGEGSSSLVGR